MLPPDLGSPDLGTADGGDGLSDAERDFIDALLRAICSSSACEDYPLVVSTHGDLDACVRVMRSVYGGLNDAVASDVVTIDWAFTDACLAEESVCPWVEGGTACAHALVRTHPRAAGDACAVQQECMEGDTCGDGSIGFGLVCPPTQHCVHSIPLDGACSGVGSGACEADPSGRLVLCWMGRCVHRRLTPVADGETCGWLPSDPDHTAVYATCPAGDGCVSTVCTPLLGAGAACDLGTCAAGLHCFRGTCTALTYLDVGAHGCASASATELCDASLDALCDTATDTCIRGGDGSVGAVCDPGLFPCGDTSFCRDGVCVARLPKGAPCDATSPCPCDPDEHVCLACP